MKASRQSTLGYTHSSSLSADGCASQKLDGDARHRQGFYLGSAAVWRNTYILRLIVLILDVLNFTKGVPYLSLYSPEDRVTNLETNPSRLQIYNCHR